MATRVKASYDASARRAASAERRARILVAARALFLAHGYPATTMSAIARESDVNIDTVYALVGRKPALFRLLVETAISGVGVPVPAEERDYVRAIQAEESAEGKLALYAESLPAIHARLAPLVDTLKAAGAAEPELAALWEEIAERRRGNMSRLAAELHATGALAVDPEVAADIIWATNAPELYLLLVEKRRWSPAQYSDWLRDTWVKGLLR
jgi:AcrR family transcriptional regulator